MNIARSTTQLVCAVACLMLGDRADASIVAVGSNAFPSTANLVDFTGLSVGTEVNGLVVNGVRFTYAVSGVPLNSAVEIDDGPGITNNIAPPNIVSVGNNAGTLTVTLPYAATMFGYGFAVLFQGSATAATDVSVFDGTTPLGSLSFNSAPDPTFSGGFAGLQSTTPFDRLELTFNPNVGPAFALDNLTFASSSSVPEPSSMFTFVIGVTLLAAIVRLPR